MGKDTILMYLGFFIIGIILFYLLRSYSSCKVVEGQLNNICCWSGECLTDEPDINTYTESSNPYARCERIPSDISESDCKGTSDETRVCNRNPDWWEKQYSLPGLDTIVDVRSCHTNSECESDYLVCTDGRCKCRYGTKLSEDNTRCDWDMDAFPTRSR